MRFDEQPRLLGSEWRPYTQLTALACISTALPRERRASHPWGEDSTMPRTLRPLQVDAIAFDLLTALIDSWTLWERVAGDVGLGRSWRRTWLRLITAARPHLPL